MYAKDLLGMKCLYECQTYKANMLADVTQQQKEKLESLEKKYNQMISSYNKMEE